MTSSKSIQVLSVDSSEEGRKSLRSCLNGVAGVSLIGEAASAADALQKLNEQQVDVVLLDLASHGLNGIELTKQIRLLHPGARVLISTASNSSDDIFSALDAGADGYLLRGNNSKALEIAIGSVRLGAVWLDPNLAKQVLDAMVSATISDKTRVLPTGVMTMPLLPEEKTVLEEVASSNCVDGVCMVDPSFLKKLRRFAPTAS